MKPDEYIKNRLDEQISWYDDKSATQKKYFYIARTLTIVFSATIPVITALVLKYHFFLYVISILGAATGVIESLMSLTKLQEKWIEYRSITETLKHEKYMYECQAGVYHIQEDSQRFTILVERVESIISQENINWANINSEEKNK